MRVLLTYLIGALAVLAVVPVLIGALPFLLMAQVTNVIIRRFPKPTLRWKDLLVFDPVLGWRNRPNMTGWHVCIDPFHVTTGADGWRGTVRMEDAQLIVLGDSFGFGHGVSDRDYFGHLPGQVVVKGVGACGYNLVQELLLLRQLAPSLRDRHVVWWIYYGNDLYESLLPNLEGYRAPFVRQTRTGGWEIVTEHIRTEPWTVETNRDWVPLMADVCGPTALAERAYSACEFVLREGLEICRSAGIRLTVMGVPDHAQLRPELWTQFRARAEDPDACDPGIPDRRVRAICDRLGIPFVALSEHLTGRHYLEFDGHWNAAGHAAVATLLGRLAEPGREVEPARTPAGTKDRALAVRRAATSATAG